MSHQKSGNGASKFDKYKDSNTNVTLHFTSLVWSMRKQMRYINVRNERIVSKNVTRVNIVMSRFPVLAPWLSDFADSISFLKSVYSIWLKAVWNKITAIFIDFYIYFIQTCKTFPPITQFLLCVVFRKASETIFCFNGVLLYINGELHWISIQLLRLNCFCFMKLDIRMKFEANITFVVCEYSLIGANLGGLAFYSLEI